MKNWGRFCRQFTAPRDGCEELSSLTWQRESDGLEIRKLGSTPNSAFTGPWFPHLCCEEVGSALAVFSTLEEIPMPGQLFEGNPVDEGTTGRSTDAPVHQDALKKDS